jgi:uncharacterized membrane protein
MDLYFLARTLHIISATVLFGTGIGIAFFFWMGMRSGEAAMALFAARTTATADMIFTLTAGIAQPLTGFWLVWLAGYDPFAAWLVITYILYLIALACWLPVVWLQLRIRDLYEARVRGEGFDEALCRRYFRWWFALGWPAFLGLVAVFWLMVAKPA